MGILEGRLGRVGSSAVPSADQRRPKRGYGRFQCIYIIAEIAAKPVRAFARTQIFLHISPPFDPLGRSNTQNLGAHECHGPQNKPPPLGVSWATRLAQEGERKVQVDLISANSSLPDPNPGGHKFAQEGERKGVKAVRGNRPGQYRQ